MKLVASQQVEVESAPRRLVASDDEVGRVLRAALEQLPQGAEHAPPVAEFQTAVERLQVRRRLRWPALAAVAAGCLWYLGPWPSARDAWLTTPAPLIEAERLVPSDTPRSVSTAEPVQPTPQEQRQSSPVPGRVAQELALRKARAADKAQELQQAQPTEPPRTQCHLLSRSGSYEQAVDCYAEQAQGSGTGAEVAWLEKARVERRALHAPKRALDTLNAYALQFPGGALRPEASLTRVELMDELGQVSEALALIDALLVERLVPTRAAELQAMRARLLARSDRCAEAEVALAEARRLGASDKYSAAVRERCAAPQGR